MTTTVCPTCHGPLLNGSVDGGPPTPYCYACGAAGSMAEPKRHKYGVAPAVERTVDGVTLDSKREARDWAELQLRQKVGEIIGLCRQVRFPLVVKGQVVETYVVDFLFFDVKRRAWVLQDSKGAILPAFRRKRKWLRDQFGLEIIET